MPENICKAEADSKESGVCISRLRFGYLSCLDSVYINFPMDVGETCVRTLRYLTHKIVF